MHHQVLEKEIDSFNKRKYIRNSTNESTLYEFKMHKYL